MDCDIYSLPLFSGGNKELIDNILQENPARHRLYAKGDIIALQGYVCKQLYLLCSGSAYARMVSEEGREFTLDTLSAPEVLASSFIFSTDGIFPVTIIAASDCSIWLISREAMLRILKADQTVMQNYLRVISDHSMFLSNRLVEFALQTLSSRIVSYIESNGPISNLQETAFILGVARPSLSRAVSQLVSQGTLRKTTDGYVLT
ncbi:MAG TPA: Crp/Fnr family transcriptional regulator [Candidatus Coprenecus pullicola]|jgi:CRP-like cAMP-binding protein|nr:Crp/Fnr family transcriptional regulator [Candidatus Coprenecus pullicola]